MNNKESKESKTAFERLLVPGVDNSWRDKIADRKRNKEWLKYSSKIALRVNRFLKENTITQIQLAERLSVSPQQVNKLLKGRENLTLETLSKLELALGIKLILFPFESKNSDNEVVYRVQKQKQSIEKYEIPAKSVETIIFDSYRNSKTSKLTEESVINKNKTEEVLKTSQAA